MNAIVAIVGPKLGAVIARYRALSPTVVWVIGAADPSDALVRSLDGLLEAYLRPYFNSEAAQRIAPIATALANRPQSAACGDFAAAVDRGLKRDLETSLAVVGLLDRADLLHPIELVVVDDDASLFGGTAIAWAKARGIPGVLVPSDVPLERRHALTADMAIAYGEASLESYARGGIVGRQLVVLPNPSSTPTAPVTNSRDARREALTAGRSWDPRDCIVVAEPASQRAGSAFAAPAGFDSSLRSIFVAFAFARSSIAGLRLVILTRAPAAIDQPQHVARVAAACGIASNEYVYAELGAEGWIAEADIVVSTGSNRSIEGAVLGVPAVNLWSAENWYLGPAFGADDGVIEVQPEALGPTLVALASNPSVAAQIANAARVQFLRFGVVSGSDSSPLAAQQLFGWKRVRAQSALVTKKAEFIIWVDDYINSSAGLRVMHRLCHLINQMGGDAAVFPATKLNPDWNAPRASKPLSDETVVIYPEIVSGNPLGAKRVVRYVLNNPGFLGGSTKYEDADMVFYYHPFFRPGAQAATTETLSDDRELWISVIEPELFYWDRSILKSYDCVYVGKGRDRYLAGPHPTETKSAYVIQYGWPASRVETAALLRGCRTLYSYDRITAIKNEALICGVEVLLLNDNGTFERFIDEDFMDDRYIGQYFDTHAVERMLRLVQERWPTDL